MGIIFQYTFLKSRREIPSTLHQDRHGEVLHLE